MTARLRHVPVPGNSSEQVVETRFAHSNESLFAIAIEPDCFVIEAINPAHQGPTGPDLSRRQP